MSIKETFSVMIQNVDEGFIRSNIYMVDNALLARALKGLAPELQEKILGNMSKDGEEEVKRLMAEQGEITDEAVESAQQEIMAMAQGHI